MNDSTKICVKCDRSNAPYWRPARSKNTDTCCADYLKDKMEPGDNWIAYETRRVLNLEVLEQLARHYNLEFITAPSLFSLSLISLFLTADQFSYSIQNINS